MKYCGKCKTTKPIIDFGKCKKSPDGFQYTCKECSTRMAREWYRQNAVKVSDSRRGNIEKYREQCRKYYWLTVKKVDTIPPKRVRKKRAKKPSATGRTAVRKTVQDYHRLGLRKGWIWCGKMPGSLVRPTSWICENLHVVEKSYEQMSSSTRLRCPVCAEAKQRKKFNYAAVEARYAVTV
jgi:hypothetical protein